MSSDQKFFDLYSLVIGVLVVFTFAILILAFRISDSTQKVYNRQGDEYKAAVAERLGPIGKVYLPGEVDESATPLLETAAAPEPVAATRSGPQVYNEACLVCHGAGIGGAPMLGDASAWGPRIDQGLDVLKDHAINGYSGELGYMPAKGGRMDLADEEVAAAVEYMVAEVE